MKFAASVRYPFLLCFLAVCLMTACSGDDGAAGTPGNTGPTGPPGPQGPPTAAAILVQSAEKINVEVLGITVPSGGGAPTVALRLFDDVGFGLKGLPAANMSFAIAQLSPGRNGGSSEWQSYLTRASAGIPNAQATTETATIGSYTDHSDGTYTYVFAKALTDYPAAPAFNATKTHRLGLEIRTSSGGFMAANIPANNAPFDFLPSGGAPIQSRKIVNDATCNACHDNLVFHGEARLDVEFCVICHNPYSIDGDTVGEPWGGSVDMTVMVHKIHYGTNLANGYAVIGFGGATHDYSDVVYSQDVRNCETCHRESDPAVPEASNWRTVQNRTACGSCHDDTDWAAGAHPGGLTFSDDTLCINCHGENSTVNGGDLRVAVAHALPQQAASEKFSFNILDITGTGIGETPVIEFSVTDPTNNNSKYNIHTDGEWTTCAGGASRLAVGIAWDTNDYSNVDSGTHPSQPVLINPLLACGGNSTAMGGGVFSVASPVAIPATVSGTLAVVLEGHPAVTINGIVERIAVTNAVAYAPVTDSTAVARRNAVNIGKCNDCHSQLSMHGNNRTDSIEACVTCHNANATDINRRAGQCLAELGADDTSIDMKYMIHALHAAGEVAVPYAVCGFGNQPLVFDFTYPGRLNNCEGCHNPGGYYPVDPNAVHGTTVSVGADIASPLDDVVISANSAVCSACHVSSLAAEHMKQNGGDFSATKAADSSLISSGTETCQLCHGPGRSADVAVVHGIGTFQFN